MLDFSVTFIITIINITVLFFVLRALLWKRVTKFMEDRTRQIEESIQNSEADKAKAKALLARYEAQLKTAEAEAKAIIDDAREQAKEEAEIIIAESRAAAEASLRNAKKQLDQEQRAALAEFRKEAAALVVEAAGRLVGREIKTEDNEVYAKLLLSEEKAEERPRE